MKVQMTMERICLLLLLIIIASAQGNQLIDDDHHHHQLVNLSGPFLASKPVRSGCIKRNGVGCFGGEGKTHLVGKWSILLRFTKSERGLTKKVALIVKSLLPSLLTLLPVVNLINNL